MFDLVTKVLPPFFLVMMLVPPRMVPRMVEQMTFTSSSNNLGITMFPFLLLARGPTLQPSTISHFTSQEDRPVMGDNDTEMLRIVDDHHRYGLKRRLQGNDGWCIAYGMP
jgi:hypothetical protein